MKVLFFSSIAEITGLPVQDVSDVSSVEALKKLLEEMYPAIKPINYAVAVNRIVVTEDVSLNEIDEVALLPPFSGG